MGPDDKGAVHEFLLDENLGVGEVANRLRQHGCRVVTVKDLGLIGHTDDEVIAAASTNRLVILSKDKRMKNRNEWRRHLVRHKVAAFFLRQGDLNAELTANAFIAALPEIGRALDSHNRPLIGTVSKSGVVKIEKV